jgi:hypothetical protein
MRREGREWTEKPEARLQGDEDRSRRCEWPEQRMNFADKFIGTAKSTK